MILSRTWNRLFVDPVKTGQRWYCHCGARFATKYGMVIEIVINDKSHWTKATIPDFSLKDAKAMMIEKNHEMLETPQELLDAIPRVEPMDAEEFMKRKPGQAGTYKFSKEVYDEMTQFEWQSLYNITEVKAYAKEMRKKEASKAKRAIAGEAA